MFMRYLGGGIGHLEQFPPASANDQDVTPYDISDEDIEETGKGNGPEDTAIADRVGHDDSGGVRICDPTTQSRSRVEPEDPVCSPYLFLLRFQPVSASLLDLSLCTIYHLISPSSLPFTC